MCNLRSTILSVCVILAATAPMQAQPEAVKGVVKLVKHRIADPEDARLTVSTYLLPATWRVEQKFEWFFGDASVPIRYRARFAEPNSAAAIEVFADVAAVHGYGPISNDPATFGAPKETGTRPPEKVLAALKELIRTTRPNVRWRVVQEKASPRAKKASPGVETFAESGTVRIEYELDGQRVEEEFTGKLDVSTMVSVGVVTSYGSIWRMSELVACRAPRGELEKVGRIAGTIRSSALPTLPFFNKLVQVQAILHQVGMDAIHQVGVRAKIFRDANQEISQIIVSQYAETQRRQDRAAEQFSDLMRGLDTYQLSEREAVKLPSGYSSAWINDRGEYLLVERPAYDPNRDLRGNWKQLMKSR